MTQIKVEGQAIVLQVKKAPFLLRFMLFLFSGLAILLPFAAIASAMMIGNAFHIKYLIAIGFGGFIGIRILRIALWNTLGKERFEFNEQNISYEANYGWFKDGHQKIIANGAMYRIEPIRYVEDGMGLLVIETNEQIIKSSVKVQLDQLRSLLEFLNTNEEFSNRKISI